MAIYIRIPKLSYLKSRLTPRVKAGAASYSVLASLAELYDLGTIEACYRARHSQSRNYVMITSQGKYILRQHVLSEETVAYEYEVLSHLERHHFPAPRMRTGREGQAWVKIDGAIYGVYDFVEGYCPADFVWWPPSRWDIFRQAGRTLAEYHTAVTGLVPTRFKWDGYRPNALSPRLGGAPSSHADLGPRLSRVKRTASGTRWRGGDFYRQPLAQIRSLLQRPTATSPVDDFARSHLDDIERLLDLESVVEERSDLTKLVIHGDYAPWNILVRADRSLFVLDFNAARLDLRIFDVIFATFWFAWRHDRLDPDRAMAFQTGYSQAGHLNETEIALAGDVFRWLMGRSIAERLRTHYLEQRFVIRDPAKLERFYKMCVWAAQQPRQLTCGLRSEETK